MPERVREDGQHEGAGDSFYNAVAESFFSTLAFELRMHSDWETREETRRGILRYIETWYSAR